MRKKYRLSLYKGENGSSKYLGKAKISCEAEDIEKIVMAFAEAGFDCRPFGEPEPCRMFVRKNIGNFEKEEE